jgi:hypothetical protein
LDSLIYIISNSQHISDISTMFNQQKKEEI